MAACDSTARPGMTQGDEEWLHVEAPVDAEDVEQGLGGCPDVGATRQPLASKAVTASTVFNPMDLDELPESSASTRSVNVEAEESGSTAAKEADAEEPRKPRQPLPRVACLACMALAVALMVLLSGLLWPRSPVWDVRELVIDPAVIQGMIAAMMNPNFTGNISVPVHTTTDISNTNFVAAQAGVGHYQVFVEDHFITDVESEPMDVAARGKTACYATAVAVMTPDLNKFIMDKVSQSNMKLQPYVLGIIPAKVWGLHVKVGIHCDMVLDVMQLLSTTPNTAITDHQCHYSLSL